MRRIKRTVGAAPLWLVLGSSAFIGGVGGYFFLRHDRPIVCKQFAHWYYSDTENTDSLHIKPSDKSDPLRFSSGCCSIKGKPDNMKEFYTIATNGDSTTGLFAIFNGYASNASIYLKQAFSKKLRGPGPEKKLNYDELLNESLDETLKEDQKTPNYQPSNGASVVACVVAENKLACSRRGEGSKAILSRGYSAYEIHPEGLKRITSFSERMLRMFGLNFAVNIFESWVLGAPEKDSKAYINIHEKKPEGYDGIPLSNMDDFIIVGSNGVWDVVDPGEAVEYIHLLRLTNRTYDGPLLSQALVYRASELGSKDNITAMVILFDKPEISRSPAPIVTQPVEAQPPAVQPAETQSSETENK